MGNIVLLDELTINKIAAGEVIERPASVVKEMVENSIDAQATNITVEIKNGGISYIRITDNGKGIAPDDMEFAFERHATSKIRQASDLETVKSMGFRGEALASIAAIANVEMVSRRPDSDMGYRVVIEGGKILEKGEYGCPVGTTITVQNLFFNTPVRYKFLKKDYTESGYIEDAITRIALSNPNVAVKLINTGKTIIQTSGDGRLENIVYSIYGRDVATNLVEVDFEYEDIHVRGVVGKPEIGRSNRANQIFFINKRYVKDKTLSASVDQAFKGLLPIGKFGFLVLDLEMNPKEVDVNVHPAKLEVRFEEESKVFRAVYNAIRSSLLKEDLVKNDTVNNEEEPVNARIETEIKTTENTNMEETVKVPSFINLFKKKNHDIPTNEVPKTIENILEKEEKSNFIEDLYNKKNNIVEESKEESKEEVQENIKVPTEEQVDKMTEILELKKNMTEQVEYSNAADTLIPENQKQNEEFDEMYVKMFGKLPPTTVTKEEQEVETYEINNSSLTTGENISVFEEKTIYGTKPVYKFIGIAFSTYIIIELENEMYIIDQHAAHERITYEKVKKNFYSQTDKDSQLMLLPDVITLTHKEMDIVKENVDLFEKAGFTLEEFGDNTIKLTGVPNICMQLDTKQLFLDILDEIDTVALTARQEKEDKFIATIACKASVKANMALTAEEVDSLMQELLVLPNPFTCPHGRPTAIKMTKYEIERKFNRK